MLEFLRRFRADETGQGFIEYALIVALIAVSLIAVIILFRDTVAKVLAMVTDTLSDTAVCGQKGKSHNCFWTKGKGPR